jgi:hypothetical protein
MTQIHEPRIEIDVQRSRILRALASVEDARTKLELRGDITGLERLRDDLQSALNLLRLA